MRTLFLEATAHLPTYERFVDHLKSQHIEFTASPEDFLKMCKKAQIVFISDHADDMHSKQKLFILIRKAREVNPELVILGYFFRLENQEDLELHELLDGYLTTGEGIMFSHEHYDQFFSHEGLKRFTKPQFVDFFPFFFAQLALQASSREDILMALGDFKKLYAVV